MQTFTTHARTCRDKAKTDRSRQTGRGRQADGRHKDKQKRTQGQIQDKQRQAHTQRQANKQQRQAHTQTHKSGQQDKQRVRARMQNTAGRRIANTIKGNNQTALWTGQVQVNFTCPWHYTVLRASMRIGSEISCSALNRHRLAKPLSRTGGHKLLKRFHCYQQAHSIHNPAKAKQQRERESEQRQEAKEREREGKHKAKERRNKRQPRKQRERQRGRERHR